MKHSLPFILFLSFLMIASCRKNDIEKDALIIGLDSRKCSCCGGWWLEIQGDTRRTLNLPIEFANQIDPNTLPMQVKIRWEKDQLTSCFQDELILIKSIRKP
jgi:hypothetical protein